MNNTPNPKRTNYFLVAGGILLSPLLVPIFLITYPFYYTEKTNRIKQVEREFKEDERIEKEKRDKHEWRLKNHWGYRLSQYAPHVSQLMIWQNHILECDQYERAILQISEAKDVPYEVWTQIQYGDDDFEEKAFLLEQMKVYGTEKYDKNTCLRYVWNYFVQKYAEFKAIVFEDAEEHMKNIVTIHDLSIPIIEVVSAS